jgi:hypothetical protein
MMSRLSCLAPVTVYQYCLPSVICFWMNFGNYPLVLFECLFLCLHHIDHENSESVLVCQYRVNYPFYFPTNPHTPHLEFLTPTSECISYFYDRVYLMPAYPLLAVRDLILCSAFLLPKKYLPFPPPIFLFSDVCCMLSVRCCRWSAVRYLL